MNNKRNLVITAFVALVLFIIMVFYIYNHPAFNPYLIIPYMILFNCIREFINSCLKLNQKEVKLKTIDDYTEDEIIKALIKKK